MYKIFLYLMKVELLHSFTSNDNKIIGRKEGLVFDQNMANQTFDAISSHSISQLLTNRQADSKMWLVFAQAVNNEFPIGNILTTFKNSIKIFVTFDAVAFFKPQLPLLNLFYYTIFSKKPISLRKSVIT